MILSALLLLALAGGGASSGPVPPDGIDDRAFEAFVRAAAQCADRPVPALLYRSTQGGHHALRLPTLAVEAQWHSTRPRSLDGITVCTNTDFGRLHMLEGQCASWPGPVSAAVWLATDPLDAAAGRRAAQEARSALAALHSRLERQEGGCALDLVLLHELVGPDRAWAYPYNSLRNAALARARTKLVALLDVDFLLSAGLHAQLAEPAAYRALLHDVHVHRDVLVLPAFETRHGLPLEQGMGLALRASTGTKQGVQQLYEAGQLTGFAPFYRRGHRGTDYERWFNASAPYPAAYERGYEPFVLASRVHVPFYDERFRGYSWDKITHTHQMVQQGFNLVVHPTAFLVHRPHPPSAAYNRTFTGPAYSRKHKPTEEMKKLTSIAHGMMREVDEGTYAQYGVTALAGCRSVHLLQRQAGAAAAATAARGSSGAERPVPLLEAYVPEWW